MHTAHHNGNGRQAGSHDHNNLEKIEWRWVQARIRYFQAKYRMDRAEEEVAWAKLEPWNTKRLNRAKRDLALTQKGLRQAEKNLKEVEEIRFEAVRQELRSRSWEITSTAA